MPHDDRPVPPFLAGEDVPAIFVSAPSAEGHDGGFDLDATSPFGGGEVSLRWILTHMIGEYARHNGHADLIRERIDGRTGV